MVWDGRVGCMCVLKRTEGKVWRIIPAYYIYLVGANKTCKIHRRYNCSRNEMKRRQLIIALAVCCTAHIKYIYMHMDGDYDSGYVHFTHLECVFFYSLLFLLHSIPLATTNAKSAVFFVLQFVRYMGKRRQRRLHNRAKLQFSSSSPIIARLNRF